MKKIHEAVRGALEKLELHYQYDEEKEVFTFQLTSDNTSYRQRLIPLEDEELLFVTTSFPIKVPEDKRFIFSNLLNKINYSQMLGYFVMDSDDGEISFRISCPVDEGAINETIVIVAISNSIKIMEEYFSEILGALASLPTMNMDADGEETTAYA